MTHSKDLPDMSPPPHAPIAPPDTHPLDLKGAWGRLSAIHAGDPRSEREPALLVPGFLSSKEDFYPVLEPLARRGWSVVAYSQRGQYLSDGPGGTGPVQSLDGYRIGDFADDLLEVAAHVGAGRPVHLVGHSFGGIVAAEAVTREPALFSSYIHWNSGPRSRFAHGHAVDLVAAAGSEALTALAATGFPDEHADWARSRVAETRSGYLLGAAMILLQQHEDAARLGHAGVRTLVAHGEHDDRWPIAWQREMAVETKAAYAVVADAGHGAQIDAPEASAELFDAFWRDTVLPGAQDPRN